MKTYYTIIRKTYGLSDNYNIDLGKQNDCFLFDIEREAYKCLELMFDNGLWINDIQYGKIRYYVEKRQYNYTYVEA